MKLITYPQSTVDFLAAQGFSKTILTRFWSKIEFTATCWLWTASRTGRNYKTLNAYGQIGTGQTRVPAHAHVVSWLIHFGKIPEGLFVLHKCDVPRCVRPGHLFLGTQADNNADMWQKGRGLIGETHPNAILTRAQVDQIRANYRRGDAKRLAPQFGVTEASIRRIVRGERWRDLAHGP